MKEKFRLYLPTGNLFAIDAAYFSGEENKNTFQSIVSDLSGDEIVEFIKSQPSIGYYEWGLEPGAYNYKLNAVLSVERHKNEVTSTDWHVENESGVLILADVYYFKDLIEAYDIGHGLTKTYSPSPAYEKKLSKYLRPEGDIVFNQIVGINYVLYEFREPGTYWIKNHTFHKAPAKRAKKAKKPAAENAVVHIKVTSKQEGMAIAEQLQEKLDAQLKRNFSAKVLACEVSDTAINFLIKYKDTVFVESVKAYLKFNEISNEYFVSRITPKGAYKCEYASYQVDDTEQERNAAGPYERL